MIVYFRFIQLYNKEASLYYISFIALAFSIHFIAGYEYDNIAAIILQKFRVIILNTESNQE
jgi:hypothetical protein